MRRTVAAVISVALLVGLSISLLTTHNEDPPRQREVVLDLETHSRDYPLRVIAYQAWEGVPYVLYYTPREGWNEIYFLAPVRNWFDKWGEWEPSAAKDAVYLSAPFTELTDAPAGLSIGPCPSRNGKGCAGEMVAFGQVNTYKITTLELDLGTTRYRYPVSFPGFAVRLGGGRMEPSNYRWLDAQGRTVWSKDQALPSSPTPRPAPLS